MLLRTCFALFILANAWAQPAPQAKPSQKGDAPLTRSSFTAKGLHREDDLNDLFVGNFAGVTFDRGSLVFSQVFDMYLEAYSRHCSAYLPANKVEMTTQVCNDGPDPVPLPGQPRPLPHGCMSWKTVSLGYADPALYAAKRRLDAEQAVNQFKDIAGSLKNPMRQAIDVAEVTSDMDALVRLNACAGAGLRRFEQNLVLFSIGKQPLLLPGAPPPVTPRRKFDHRPRSHKTPANFRFDCTEAVARLRQQGDTGFQVSLVVLNIDGTPATDALRLDGVSLNFID